MIAILKKINKGFNNAVEMIEILIQAIMPVVILLVVLRLIVGIIF